MKTLLLLMLWIWSSTLSGQGFACTGSFYILMYSESEGRSKLYEVSREQSVYTFDEIVLNSPRRMTGLAYNTDDSHLWALDIDQFELVRINRFGDMDAAGKIEGIDSSLSFSSGMISPDGNTYYFIGYNLAQDRARTFYEINLKSSAPFTVQSDDISASGRSRILDMAVDPIFGSVYGYNNINGTIVQFGIDGQIATISQTRRDEQSIEALFFDRDAQMFGYTPKGELYAVDKVEGNLQFIQRGPQGILVDGCACPYTHAFFKDISSRQMIPCEPFEVQYTFRNNLGISQTGVRLRDTFPEGFEILDIKATIPYTRLKEGVPDNVLALNNMIYLMGNNTITVRVLPSEDFSGSFASQARQEPFPRAFSPTHFSDDPSTSVENDATATSIELIKGRSLRDDVQYSCDGTVAHISTDVTASSYQWNTGETQNSIDVTAEGLYIVEMGNACLTRRDSVFIYDFPEDKIVSLGEDVTITAGDSVYLTPRLNRGVPEIVEWFVDGTQVLCENCEGIWLSPPENAEIGVIVEDREGCLTSDEVTIRVEYEQHLYVPNIFSPNGDGINDVFFISSSVPGVLKLSIYSRWGNLVYQESNIPLSDKTRGWDGMINGTSLNSGSYIWMAEIRYINGEEELLSGEFAVIAK